MKFNTDLARVQKELSKGGFSLYPHQKVGVKWLLKTEKTYNGGILADEMGLGKTIQIISMMIANPKPLNLIVCPASLVKQWETEINKFAPSINIYSSTIDEIDNTRQNVFIISYNKLNRESLIRWIKYDRLICDEAHYFRNKKSKTFKNLDQIRSTVKWCITGTPIQNYKSDIITLFKFLRKDGEITDMISKYLIRRTVKELEFKLPDIHYSIKFIKSHNKKLTNMIENNESMFHLEKILRLKQASVIPSHTLNSIVKKYSQDHQIDLLYHKKLNTIIRDCLNAPKNKTIIFSYFRSEIKYLYDGLSPHLNVGTIDGSTNKKTKEILVNSVEHDILIIQINAGGTGLNLQQYNNVIFTAPQWNPTLEQQAIARVYRIGQMCDVNVKRYIIGKIDEHTIEKKIIAIQKSKLELIKKYIK